MVADEINLTRIEDYLWEIPRQGGMRVPGRIYANDKLMTSLKEDNSLRQVMNVAHLPGIVGYSLAMPIFIGVTVFPSAASPPSTPRRGFSPGGASATT